MRFLTTAEEEIMSVLWKHGTLKPAEIQQRFSRDIHNATLRTLLRVLLNKGHVKRAKRGKAFHYTAVTKQKTGFQKVLRNVIDVYCGGSAASLAAHLIDSEKLSKDDLEYLREALNATKRDHPKGAKKND